MFTKPFHHEEKSNTSLLTIFFLSVFVFLYYVYSTDLEVITTTSNSSILEQENLAMESDFKQHEIANAKTLEDIFNGTLDRIQNLPNASSILGGREGQLVPMYNFTCAIYPTISNIKFNSVFWQKLETSFGDLFFYGAYYDNRNLKSSTESKNGFHAGYDASVRILGMMEWDVPLHNISTFCQIWFENDRKPVFAQVVEQNYIWMRGWGRGRLQPFLLTCKINKTQIKYEVPQSISVVLDPCDYASNNLRVHYNHDSNFTRKNFAVCVKALDFPHEDISFRLVEWIELIRLLGSDKIFFYELAVHPNVSKVLKYYEKTGFIDVTPITLPGDLSNDPVLRHIFLSIRNTDKRQNELIPYNDCLYKNLYNYEYLTLLDTDEVIIPMNVNTWNELIIEIAEDKPYDFPSSTSIVFRNVYFFDSFMKNKLPFPDIPSYMHQLQHVCRSRNYSGVGETAKYFLKPERVVTVHNHFPTDCFVEKCKPLNVETTVAHVQHYKKECPKTLVNCSWIFGEDPVTDTTIWKYKDELVNRSLSALNLLGFIQ